MIVERWLGSALRIAQRFITARTVARGGYEPGIVDIIRQVRPYTMTSPARVAALCDAITHIVRYEIPGAFVECGVWKGGSSMAAALRLLQLHRTDRFLYLFDTFEGMPPPGEHDRSRTSGFAAAAMLKSAPPDSNLLARAPIEEVLRNLQTTGYPPDKVRLVRGRVQDTVPRQAPEQIAVLRLDTDWYDSTLHELVHLFPRLVSGGILVIDDYGDWQGAREAVDEYFSHSGTPIFLHRIDHTGRIAVKASA